ncbi:MAG: MOSC domain-containing protein [Bacteroidota bacterium]|jgi:MOSC domain-containing protein YiiM
MNHGHGVIVALSLSAEKGTPKNNREEVRLIENWGIEGDAHAGNWHRQVSLLAMESIEKIHALGLDVRPGAFAENITTHFVDLLSLQIGDRVHVGGAELEITQIGKECHQRCVIFEQVGDCVMPREGLFARVLRGGIIRSGDPVILEKVIRS